MKKLLISFLVLFSFCSYATGKLLIYYGYPSLVTINANTNPIGSLVGVSQALSDYDVIVLGAGLESPTHEDNANTKAIIAGIHDANPSCVIFGYVDLGVSTNNYSIAQMQNFVQQWQTMGVNGIFWDDAGYDFKVTRARQNTMILYARSLGLSSFMNAWLADDIFSSVVNATANPLGSASVMGSQDWFLLESLPYNKDTGWMPRATVIAKVQNALNWRKSMGSKIAAVSIIDYSVLPYAQQQSYRSLIQAFGFVASLDACGDCAYGFSSSGPNANRIFKGWWDSAMKGMAYQTLLQDTATTFNRHDYETVIMYVDGKTPTLTTPLSLK